MSLPHSPTSRPIEQGNMEVQCDGSKRVEKSSRKKNGVRSRCYVFTYFYSHTQDIQDLINEFESRDFKYMMGDEICPTTGRAHLQGWCKNKTVFAKSVMTELIKGGWNRIAKGSELDNWKYTSKEGKHYTNVIAPELTPKELVQETCELRIDTNPIMIEKRAGNFMNYFQVKGIEMLYHAVEFAKYYNMIHGYVYLSGTRTEMKKTLAKMYDIGKLKGIVVVGNCDRAFIAELQSGMINDHNGRTLFWDQFSIDCLFLHIIE